MPELKSPPAATAQPQPPEVLILGLGNPLMSDDGVGARLVEMLAARELPPGVMVQDAGLPGWGLPSWFEGKQNVILVDAVQMGGQAGDWRRFLPEEIRVELEGEALSLHQPDLACGLALAQALALLPERLVLYGIEPLSLAPGGSLSPAVSASLPVIIDRILLDVEKMKNEQKTNPPC